MKMIAVKWSWKWQSRWWEDDWKDDDGAGIEMIMVMMVLIVK
jgi:hypothetical protein